MKPEQIFLNIINLLNEYKIGQPIQINDLNEKLPHHYNTIKDYLKIIDFIQNACPKIKNNVQTETYELNGYNPLLDRMDQEEQLILYLFIEKIFDEKTARNIDELMGKNQYNFDAIKKSPYINYTYEINKISNNRIVKIWLSRRGGLKAQGLFSKLYEIMKNYLDSPSSILELNKEELIPAFKKHTFDVVSGFDHNNVKCLESSNMGNIKLFSYVPTNEEINTQPMPIPQIDKNDIRSSVLS
jgi:hypothetical protein